MRLLIQLTGMGGGIATLELAGAVARAGGLGMLGFQVRGPTSPRRS